LGRLKVFESHHRARQPLDASMILLNQIVQVFALADFNTFVVVTIKLVQKEK